MIKKIFSVTITIVIYFLFQSCGSGVSGTWTNEHIDKNKQEQIKVLNDKLFKAIINNDAAGVKALMSDQLIENAGADLDKLINQASTAFKADKYRILEAYNIQNSSPNMMNTLPSDASGDNDHVISFQAMNKEMYVSLLLPEGMNNELLITAIYGNYNNEWKLNILQFGQYSLFKKTAPDYYKLAKESYGQSYLIDAVNYISLSKQCLRPANNTFQYLKEKEINEFYEQLMKEVNTKYTFPMTLENIDTKPKIFRIFPEMINEGFFPMVYYVSEINLKDTTALKIENNKVKKEVGRLFTGIDKNKKFVFYKTANEVPDGTKAVEQYGFVDQLEK